MSSQIFIIMPMLFACLLKILHQQADRLKALNDVADLARDDAKALPIGIVADDNIPCIG